ncbi:MAG: FecR domain-containing protein [Candidatus Competibacter sp.]|nr:FecR domain-containing protein [Candidatus Competibacter sp.]MDG4606971.1 FecR family protein [Candidatus Contendobacter sp.]HRD49943.1 FecR family protein [Candidatus Contendobacter sp.]
MRSCSRKGVVGAFLGLALLSAAWAAEPEPAGHVTRVQGGVRALPAEPPGGPSRPLGLGKPIYAGERLLTDPDARLEIRLRNGVAVTLGEKTEFVVQSVPDAGNGEGGTFMELARGVFRAITPKTATDRPQPVQVRTPVAVIGIRGTDFWGGFHFQPGALDVVMLAGKGVYVETLAGRVELATPGQGTTVSDPTRPPEAPQAWPQTKLRIAQDSVAWREAR